MFKCCAQTGCILLIFKVVVFCSGLTSKRYMTDYCMKSKDILLNNSMILDLTDNFFDEYQAEFEHCATDVVTSPGNRIMLHFITLEISYDEQTPDRLHIFDYGTNNLPIRLTPATGVFGVYETYEHMTSQGIKDYRSTMHKMRLDFLGKPTVKYNGFSVLLTSFKDADNFKCKSHYLRCSVENICVPESIRCDGHSNCGTDDSSDEKGCISETEEDWRNSFAATTALIVGVVASGIFLCTALIIGLLVYKMNKRRFSSTGGMLPSRRSNRNASMASDGDLTRMYAPPSYEDVIGAVETNDPPPDYSSVASQSPRISYKKTKETPSDKKKINSDSSSHSNIPSPAYENIEIDRPHSANIHGHYVKTSKGKNDHSVSKGGCVKGTSIRCQPVVHRMNSVEDLNDNGTDTTNEPIINVQQEDGCDLGRSSESIDGQLKNQN